MNKVMEILCGETYIKKCPQCGYEYTACIMECPYCKINKQMKITDIIGKGKIFEPPFYVDGMYIFDNQHQIILELRGFTYLQYFYNETDVYDKVYPTIANYIVNLLNKQNYE